MSLAARPLPTAPDAVAPRLVCRDTHAAIGFYREALGARLVSRRRGPDGRVRHAAIRLGGSVLFLGEDGDASGVTIHLYVDDADAAITRAVGAGATVTVPPRDARWGDRCGRFADPFGHHWSVATREPSLSRREMAERGAAAMA